MGETYFTREGSTQYIVFNLQEDKAALNLTSADHVVLLLKSNAGKFTSFSTAGGSPKLHITNAAGGVVELRPAGTEFLHDLEPYDGYFKVYEDATIWFPVPNDPEKEVTIRVGAKYE